MKRFIFNFASTLSLLLFITSCAVWMRSYWAWDAVQWEYGDVIGSYSSWNRFESGLGGIGWCWFVREVSQPARIIPNIRELAVRRRFNEPPKYPAAQEWPSNELVFGFFYNRAFINESAGRLSMIQLIVPAWSVAGLTSILPGLWLRRWSRSRNSRRQGLCSSCGYDLRATPERCPECGATAVPKEAA